MLTIQLTKRPNGKLPLLICTRPDGSQTLAEIGVDGAASSGGAPPPPDHDLTHYAVETTLGLRNSFYGLLARGHDIRDFTVAGAAQKLDIPPEAVWTEFVVALLQTERRAGRRHGEGAFRAQLNDMLRGARDPIAKPDRPAPPNDTQLHTIRTTVAALLKRWRALPPGESMTLEFPGEGE